METGLKSIPCWNHFPRLIYFVVNKEYFLLQLHQNTHTSGFGIQTWDNLDHRGNYASTVISLFFAKSSFLPLFASNLVFQGGNPQSLSLLCCFLVCPWQVKSTLSRTLFLRIFILGEIVWPSSLALFIIVFYKNFCSGKLFDPALWRESCPIGDCPWACGAQLHMCKVFDNSYFLLRLQKNWTFENKFSIFSALTPIALTSKLTPGQRPRRNLPELPTT